MGAYFFYINETKGQYFSIDPFMKCEIKSSFVGQGAGSRGLSFLLWGETIEDPWLTPTTHSLIGSWVGDRVTVASDHHYAKYDELDSDFNDIANDVVEMLIAVEPFAILKDHGVDWMLSLINGKLEHTFMTPAMKTSLLNAFTLENESYPSDQLASLIDAMSA